MGDDAGVKAEGVVRLGAREIPPPANVSDEARAMLAMPRPAGGGSYPDPSDKESWRRLIASRVVAAGELAAQLMPKLKADVEAAPMGGVPVYKATPQGERLLDDRHIVFDIHGGALIFSSGETSGRLQAAFTALRTGRVTYAVDYRVPPDGPYPAALDDCMAAYRALLEAYPAERIVVSGISAGGNLAAALLLRAKDEGLPTPGGALLITPELDLTESGDTFDTLMGLDVILGDRLMPINLLYADGADLSHPYLSPLFGDVAGFPPTLLQAGTRDIFLSNAVIMHRKLRRAGVRAELHVWEGMPHGGFGGLAPEDRELNEEIQAFLASL